MKKKINLMKQVLLAVLMAVSVMSCSLDDDNNIRYEEEFDAIESVDIPEEFELNAVHEISMTYLRPSDCHTFYDFFYQADGNERTVAVRTIYPVGQDCEVLNDEEVEVSFNFEVLSTETYVFRFYQGEDEDGEDIYYIAEVPVAVD